MKLRRTLIVSVIVIAVGFVAIEYICNQKEACKCSAYSIDKGSAIEEGFYIDTYAPINETYLVSNVKDTIHFDSAWSEHGWEFSKGLCLLKHKLKGHGFNVCIPFTTTNSDVSSYSFTLAPIIENKTEEGISSYVSGRINFQTEKTSDTIRLLIKENKITGSDQIQNRMDTILFVKTSSSK
jgi:hypothetical protein